MKFKKSKCRIDKVLAIARERIREVDAMYRQHIRSMSYNMELGHYGRKFCAKSKKNV